MFDAFNQEFIDRLAAAIVALTPAAQMTNRVMTTAVTGVYLSRSEIAVKHLIARGKIPVVTLDGKKQVDKVALDKLIDELNHFEG
jgi:hypothetical protein